MWGSNWIHLARDRDQWLALLNAVMELRVLAFTFSGSGN
jgi:hypothetical protein